MLTGGWTYAVGVDDVMAGVDDVMVGRDDAADDITGATAAATITALVAAVTTSSIVTVVGGLGPLAVAATVVVGFALLVGGCSSSERSPERVTTI